MGCFGPGGFFGFFGFAQNSAQHTILKSTAATALARIARESISGVTVQFCVFGIPR